jgi:hypothetical protein
MLPASFHFPGLKTYGNLPEPFAAVRIDAANVLGAPT